MKKSKSADHGIRSDVQKRRFAVSGKIVDKRFRVDVLLDIQG